MGGAWGRSGQRERSLGCPCVECFCRWLVGLIGSGLAPVAEPACPSLPLPPPPLHARSGTLQAPLLYTTSSFSLAAAASPGTPDIGRCTHSQSLNKHEPGAGVGHWESPTWPLSSETCSLRGRDRDECGHSLGHWEELQSRCVGGS